jgi:hypothetical protein
MSATNTDLISLKNGLKASAIVQKIKAIVRERLGEIDYQQFKLQPDLILFICRLVWTLSYEFSLKNRTDEHLKQLTCDVYVSLFTLSANEIGLLNTQIDFFINNKQIKPVALKKKIIKLGKWILKKVF